MRTLTTVEEVLEFTKDLKEVEVTEVDGTIQVYSRDRHVANVTRQVWNQMKSLGGKPEIRE